MPILRPFVFVKFAQDDTVWTQRAKDPHQYDDAYFMDRLMHA